MWKVVKTELSNSGGVINMMQVGRGRPMRGLKTRAPRGGL